MSHIPTSLDIKTDLRRTIMASFSEKGFQDDNVKFFLENAEKILKTIKLDKKTYKEVADRIKKAKDDHQQIGKRREDLLLVSSLI